jgi:hypothetical protein
VLKSSPSITRPKIPPTTAEVKAIVDRYRRGDVTLTDAEIGSLLDAFPSMVQANGSPARHLADILLDNYSKSLVIKESVRRTLVEVREELEGPNPSPLESLLAERAAICWLTVNAGSSRPSKRWRRSASWGCRTSRSTWPRIRSMSDEGADSSLLPTSPARWGRE